METKYQGATENKITEALKIGNDFLQQFNESVLEAERVLEITKDDMNVSGETWIITIGKICVEPVFTNGRTTGELKHGTPYSVKRFTYNAAKKIADKVRNGNGQSGIPQLWRLATVEYIKDLRTNIAAIEERITELQKQYDAFFSYKNTRLNDCMRGA